MRLKPGESRSGVKHSTTVPLCSFLPLMHSRRVVVSYKRKYVHKLLVNCPEKSVVK